MIGLMAVALLVGAFGGDSTEKTPTAGNSTGNASIVGRYNCQQPGATEQDLIELQADGKLKITQGGQTVEGTWSAQGSSGAFGPGTPEEEKFTIQEGRLVFGDGTVCTKAA